MAKSCIVFFLINSLVIAAVYARIDLKVTGEKDVGSWCVARESAADDKLQAFIDYACGKIDCGLIQPGAACFEPDTKQKHASFALNQIYRSLNNCNSDIGQITNVNPSYGSCVYA